MLLARRDKSLSNIIHVLTEYRENIGDPLVDEPAPDEEEEKNEEEEMGEVEEQKAILTHLITYLESLDV